MTDQDVRALARKIFQLEEKVAALSRARQLTSSSVPITVDGDDGPEVIDVPLATGVSQGVQASFESKYAKELAEQLQEELGPLPEQVREALDEAAEALASAGLAKTEAAQAVADAATASAQATKAVEDALAAARLAQGAAPSWATVDPVAGDAAGKPVGAIWFVREASGSVLRMWELTALGWVKRPFDETVIPQLAIGSGTYGTLAGDRLVARSVTAAQIQALAITANELAANSVVAVKIAANAVTAAKIIAGAVTTDKLNALAVTAEKIAVGAIIADKIAAGAITTAKLAATAIDGMLITGALIRTAPSGQRMELDANGLRAINTAGQTVATMSPTGAGLMVGMPNSARFQVLRDEVRDGTYAGVTRPGNYPTGKSNMARLVVDDIFADKFYDSAALELAAGGTSYASFRAGPAASSDHGAAITVTGALQINATQEIEFNAARVKFPGDTDWIRLDGWTGSFAHSSEPLMARKRDGWIEFRGALYNATWAGALTSFGAVMPSTFAPRGNQLLNLSGNANITRSAFFLPNGGIQLYSSSASGAWWWFTGLRYEAPL